MRRDPGASGGYAVMGTGDCGDLLTHLCTVGWRVEADGRVLLAGGDRGKSGDPGNPGDPGNLGDRVPAGGNRAGLLHYARLINHRADAASLRALLEDPGARRAVSSAAAEICRHHGYDGCWLEITGPAPDQRDNLAALVEETAWLLHREGRSLAVTAAGRSREPDSGDGGRPRAWADLYDYWTLGIYADQFIMALWELPGGFRADEDPGEAGLLASPRPPATWGWVRACLDYALERVPARRLVMGLPFYGRLWRREEGGWRPGPVMAPADLAAGDHRPLRDENLGCSCLQATEGVFCYHELADLQARIALVVQEHLGGVALRGPGLTDRRCRSALSPLRA